ncbi:MAG: putative ABC transport system permease protein [Gammaproteobacteria bacterium]|jgi:putative ABC transport system permease protein
MSFLIKLAWHDLRSSGRSLWIFCACLILGVTLVAASGGLYRLIEVALLADTRVLMGGDVEVDAKEPLPQHVLGWIKDNGELSRVTEVDTMLGTDNGFLRIELQSMDELYPLYGELVLEPALPLSALTSFKDGYWGVAIDPFLANKLSIGIGDDVYVGSQVMKVRALVVNQPDRSLSADWRGTPVLLAQQALQASELIQPGSRIDYDYHVRTNTNAEVWRNRFYQAFPHETWRVRTFNDRSRRLSERLGQIASGLLIIGFSTLFIGGLGVFNSIQSYLQGKLKTIATLRALGLRNRRLAMVYLLQVGILSGGASLVGVLIGGGLALIGAAVIADQVPVATTVSSLLLPNLIALMFGVFTAFTFALPAIGRALSVQPASLFRGSDSVSSDTPTPWWIATLFCGGSIILLVLVAMPDLQFGLGFMGVIGLLLLLLDFIVRGIRHLARSFDDHPLLSRYFALKLAMANLHRPGTPLRTSLLSLGSALTLLVACTLIVGALVRAINATIPEESPALIMYDASSDQVQNIVNAIEQSPSVVRVDMAPLVRSRIAEVNGRPVSELFEISNRRRRNVSQDEYKLSYSANNIDNVNLVDGAWWDDNISGMAKMAMEDREAEQLGLKVGDIVTFAIAGRSLQAEVAAIYSQKGVQTKFWFEGIVSDGALDTFINRYVGAAYMDDNEAIAAQGRVAQVAPNVISVRTASLLASAREILGQATAGLAVVAGVSLAASLLVLISVMAAGRTRQIYDATVLHSLGTRLSVIKSSLHMEYLLLAFTTSIFAVIAGSAIALPLLNLRLKLPSEDLIWLGLITAISVSGIALSLGARYMLRRLQLKPAILLRSVN